MITKILVSNIALPTDRIGSWTKRISYFNERNHYFDFILSPTEKPDNQHIYCRKRKRLAPPFLKNLQLKHWIAKDYLEFLKKASNTSKLIKVVVMDDLALLEAITEAKHSFSCKIKIIFSFHGHLLHLPKHIGEKVDKILFLTRKGYLESVQLNETFTPEVEIIGNGVRSEQFFPLPNKKKTELKMSLGFNNEDEIIVWMANERPNKGLHLFVKIAHSIVSRYKNIKVLIIGNSNEVSVDSKDIQVLGRLNHDLLPRYLQISDYYFFTTLWKEGFGLSLVEAMKCGNIVIASKNGGVEEVVMDYPDVFLVEAPNIIESWLTAFEKAKKSYLIDTSKIEHTSTELQAYHSYEDWELRFLKAID